MNIVRKIGRRVKWLFFVTIFRLKNAHPTSYFGGFSRIYRGFKANAYVYIGPRCIIYPKVEIGENVETWKFKIITRPEKRDFPAQKINVDISLLPSRERKVQMLKNQYGLELGTNGILLYAESLSEILCDKLIAFARRPNRVKNRDLFDIHFLRQKNVPVNYDLLAGKLADRGIAGTEFWAQFSARCDEIVPAQENFVNEMRRFLPATHFTSDFRSPLWWEYLQNLLKEISRERL